MDFPTTQKRLQSHRPVPRDALDLGKVPLLVAQGTDGARLEPSLDAIEVEDVSAVPERDAEAVVVGGARVGLVLDRRLVEGVAANGALEGVSGEKGGLEKGTCEEPPMTQRRDQ